MTAGPHAPYPPAGWATPQTSTSAIAALALAIVSFVVFPIVPAIVALILARNADEEIAAGAGHVTGKGLAKAARITAWVNIAFSALLLLAAAVAFLSIGVFV